MYKMFRKFQKRHSGEFLGSPGSSLLLSGFLWLCVVRGLSLQWLLLLSRACGLQQLWLLGLVAPRCMWNLPGAGIKPVSYTDRQILNYWATREVYNGDILPNILQLLLGGSWYHSQLSEQTSPFLVLFLWQHQTSEAISEKDRDVMSLIYFLYFLRKSN